jgi:hypothetical protein
MILFINEDEAYLHWIGLNPTGFVVNARRRPSADYLKLHRATCNYISSQQRENWTTNLYIKIFALDASKLIDWARQEIGGELNRGCHCNSLPQACVESFRLNNAQSSHPSQVAWTLWRPVKELASVPLEKPLKASWEAKTHPDQCRLNDYRRRIQEALAQEYAEIIYI